MSASPGLAWPAGAALGQTNRTDLAFEIIGADRLGEWPSNTRVLRGTVFQSREFIDLWLSTIGAAIGASFHGVIVRDGEGRALLWLPLVVKRRRGIRRLGFPDRGVSDTNGPILADGVSLSPEAFAGLWPAILRALPPVDVVDLRKMPGLIGDAINPLCGLPSVSYGSMGHVLDLSTIDAGGPKATSDHVSHMARMEQGRRRMARELGPVQFEVAGDGPTTARFATALFAFKSAQYQRTYGFDAFDEPGRRAFYESALARPGLALVAAETCGPDVTAAALCFLSADSLTYVLPAYDADRYARFSPGARLLADLIGWSQQSGYRIFDLGEGAMPYKDRWVTSRVALHSHVCARSALGSAYLLAQGAMRHPRVRGWLARVRQWRGG